MLYDVVAVNMQTNKVQLLGNGLTKINAEAIAYMAVIRRGCEEEFFAPVSAGKYRDGDEWRPEQEG